MEAEKSQILGLELVKHELQDGFFNNDETHQLELVKVIREYQPNIVLCNAVMIDTLIIQKLQSLCLTCFLAGLRKIETGQGYLDQKRYIIIFSLKILIRFVVDVSDFIEQKMSGEAFSSQFYNPQSQEPNTIISSQAFLDSIRYRAADLGRLSGVDFAEGFTVEKLPVLNFLEDLS